ncbi:MAG: glycosyl transferase family 1 [Bacteroidia bacterium]|nr:glycosyl transferase family 1 [Bacteroidia bacterium]
MLKKVLIITYYWPPSGGSGVQRWLKFAKYLPEFGWEPIIFTVENGEFPVIDESLLKEIPKGLTVIKKPIWEPFNLYKKFTGQKKEEKFGHGFAAEKKSGGFKKTLQNTAVWVRGNYFIPDARKFFIKPSIEFLEKYLKENNITHVITTGPPHSMHLIGLGLKKKLNIKWIADFRDPWTGVYYFKDLKLSNSSFNKHRELENEVLLNADKIISVGKNLKINLDELAGKEKMKDRSVVITNGYDFDLKENKTQLSGSEFSITYTGLFSKDQNHDALWEAMGELLEENKEFRKALKIKTYGKIDASILIALEKNGLQNNFEKFEYIPLNEIGEVQRRASLLLLCINHYPGEKEMLTGKLFDYICSNRPILNVGPLDGDAADIISETQTGETFVRTDKAGIKNFLAASFEKFKKNELKISPKAIEKYSRRELSRKLSEELNSL